MEKTYFIIMKYAILEEKIRNMDVINWKSNNFTLFVYNIFVKLRNNGMKNKKLTG